MNECISSYPCICDRKRNCLFYFALVRLGPVTFLSLGAAINDLRKYRLDSWLSIDGISLVCMSKILVGYVSLVDELVDGC